MTATVDVRSGAIYLPAAVAGAYFSGLDAVAVVVGDGFLRILPVRHLQSGGYLLKIRNAAGDRVIAVMDLLRAHDLDGWRANGAEAVWSPENGALMVAIDDAPRSTACDHGEGCCG